MMAKRSPVIIVHGGAWSIPENLTSKTLDGVKDAVKCGYLILKNGGSAIDAVEAAISFLENDPNFDAGCGSVLNEDGEVEMDAIIMSGKSLNAGAIASVVNIKNPIQLARMVMEKTDHVLLVGHGANKFAAKCGVEQVSPKVLVTDSAYEEWVNFKKFREAVNTLFGSRHCDTVGAVALDDSGHLACGTSTGGITAKMVGRVGDAPIIGCGAYCDDEVGGVSCTGHGESILKVGLARHIIELLKSGQAATTAVTNALKTMQDRVNGQGGAITINCAGDIGLHFTTERMAWAFIKDAQLHYGIDIDRNFEEELDSP